MPLSPPFSSAPGKAGSSAASVAAKTPALVATLQWGVSSEVWIRRQLAGFARLAPEVICWERRDRPGAPDPVRVRVMEFEPQPQERPSRWWWRLRNLPQRNFYGSVGAERRALERVIRASGARVILCHFGHMALRLLPAARACGVPLVAHFHGLDVSSGLRNRWYRTSLLRHLSGFAAIVVVGSHQRRWMIEQGVPAERVHLIPCGVPTTFFSPPGKPAPAASSRLRIAAVSRLVPWKGLAESIGALGLARDQGVDAELHILGDGEQRAELEALAAQLDLTPFVRFLGPGEPDAVRELLAGSDLFVQHSLTSASGWCEGFGVSLAEAASMALPVIATRSGGIPDQVVEGVTGLLVDEHDIPGMAAAIRRLAAEPGLRQRLGSAGRQRMIEHFDLDRQIARLEAVLLTAAR